MYRYGSGGNDRFCIGVAGVSEPFCVLNNICNVGIGTAGPTAKLQIGGTAGVGGIKFPDGTLQTSAGGSVDVHAASTTTHYLYTRTNNVLKSHDAEYCIYGPTVTKVKTMALSGMTQSNINLRLYFEVKGNASDSSTGTRKYTETALR